MCAILALICAMTPSRRIAIIGKISHRVRQCVEKPEQRDGAAGAVYLYEGAGAEFMNEFLSIAEAFLQHSPYSPAIETVVGPTFYVDDAFWAY